MFALDSVWHITTQLNYYLFCYVHLQTSVDALVQACVVVDMVDEASIIGNNRSSCNIHPFATRGCQPHHEPMRTEPTPEACPYQEVKEN